MSPSSNRKGWRMASPVVRFWLWLLSLDNAAFVIAPAILAVLAALDPIAVRTQKLIAGLVCENLAVKPIAVIFLRPFNTTIPIYVVDL